MAKKMFTVYRLDHLKEHTANMFQQCGGSGGVSENVKEIPEPPYHYSPRVAELKICTLESTYRNASNISSQRHCVSESNLFMHQDADWFRQPRSLARESGNLRSASRDFNIVSGRYPTADNDPVETVTTRAQTPANVLVRFKTFLGMDGSTQKVEIVTDNVDFGPNNITIPDENGTVRMKTLFAARRSAPRDGASCNVESNSTNTFSDKIDKVKTLMKTKRPKVKVNSAEITKTPVDPAGRIVRMKNLFGNRTPVNVLQIESKITANKPKSNFGRIKTLFNTDASSQTDDVTPTGDGACHPIEEPPQNNRVRLKKLMGFKEKSQDDIVAKAIDDRQVFSRQSTPPARGADDHQVPPRRVPLWLDHFVRRIQASVSGARVNDIEIPDIVVEPTSLPPDDRRKKPGTTSGWQWRHGVEIQEVRDNRSVSKPLFDCKKFTLPSCSFPKASLVGVRNTSPEEPLPFVQVIALICGVLVVVLMALGLASADWLMAAGWRQGLFSHCVEEGAPTPLPFNLVELPGCYASRDVGYIRAAAALCILTLCADVVGSLLTALGLRATDHRTKYKYYRLAVLAMALALISILIALVIYPVCFAAELNLGNRTVWEFGWAYGVGWGAAIFLFGAVILLLCDKESEEIYYKERKVEREPPGGGP